VQRSSTDIADVSSTTAAAPACSSGCQTGVKIEPRQWTRPRMIQTPHPDASGRFMHRPATILESNAGVWADRRIGLRHDDEATSDYARIKAEREARWRTSDELEEAKRHVRWLALAACAAIAWAVWATGLWMRGGAR
jgi:hypothetical protein